MSNKIGGAGGEGEEKTKEIFFFKEGCVVFWNVPELERNQVLNSLKPFCEESYDDSVVFRLVLSEQGDRLLSDPKKYFV